VKRLIVILVVLIPFAQSRAEQLPIRTYTTADGLPRDSIHKIVPDPRGYLWFCTSDGLSRFDGYEFVNYSTAHGLPHRMVYDLLITRSGDYWAGTAAGSMAVPSRTANGDAGVDERFGCELAGAGIHAMGTVRTAWNARARVRHRDA
jgi:hypothetical protein